MLGKCPKCEKLVTSLGLSTVEAHAPSGQNFHAVNYLCPHCQTILGAGIDPVALGNDIGALVMTAVEIHMTKKAATKEEAGQAEVVKRAGRIDVMDPDVRKRAEDEAPRTQEQGRRRPASARTNKADRKVKTP